MTIRKDVGLLKKILVGPHVVHGISKFKLFSIIKKYNLNHLYVGNRIDYFPVSYSICIEEKLNGESEEKKGRLFYHEPGDECYYDMLDENKECHLQGKNHVLIASHVCVNVSTLESCLSAPKVKCIGGKKWKV